MLSPKQNFLETLKRDGHPDRLVNQYEYGAFLRGDPINMAMHKPFYMGMDPQKDAFGTTFIWPDGYAASMPHVTDDNKVIPDITRWKEFLKLPQLAPIENDTEKWDAFRQTCESVDHENKLVMAYMPTGIFERLHFLMGFEDLFLAFYEEPEDLSDLIKAIADHRYRMFEMMIEKIHPDIILSHDDWGSKTSLFIKPELWREFIKPHYDRIYGMCHENNVIVVHHSDSFCEPIVEDMADCHIDVWQGVLPQNDIVMLQQKMNGRITLQGGLESAIADNAETSEEEVRRHVRETCELFGPGGHFIPGVTNGGPGCLVPGRYKMIEEEIDRYNIEHFGGV